MLRGESSLVEDRGLERRLWAWWLPLRYLWVLFGSWETRLSCCAVAVVWLCGTAYRRTEGVTAGLSGDAGSSRQREHRGFNSLL